MQRVVGVAVVLIERCRCEVENSRIIVFLSFPPQRLFLSFILRLASFSSFPPIAARAAVLISCTSSAHPSDTHSLKLIQSTTYVNMAICASDPGSQHFFHEHDQSSMQPLLSALLRFRFACYPGPPRLRITALHIANCHAISMQTDSEAFRVCAVVYPDGALAWCVLADAHGSGKPAGPSSRFSRCTTLCSLICRSANCKWHLSLSFPITSQIFILYPFHVFLYSDTFFLN